MRQNDGEDLLRTATLPGTTMSDIMTYSGEGRLVGLIWCDLAKLGSTMMVLKQKNKMNMVMLSHGTYCFSFLVAKWLGLTLKTICMG
jgi:hypothetical protein